MRRGVEPAGIISVSPIPPFASGFKVNDCGHLTPILLNVRTKAKQEIMPQCCGFYHRYVRDLQRVCKWGHPPTPDP